MSNDDFKHAATKECCEGRRPARFSRRYFMKQGGVAMVDVEDVKTEADKLRGEGVEVGVVLELAGQMRLVDVFDPDGNRIQLAQHLEA